MSHIIIGGKATQNKLFNMTTKIIVGSVGRADDNLFVSVFPCKLVVFQLYIIEAWIVCTWYMFNMKSLSQYNYIMPVVNSDNIIGYFKSWSG